MGFLSGFSKVGFVENYGLYLKSNIIKSVFDDDFIQTCLEKNL